PVNIGPALGPGDDRRQVLHLIGRPRGIVAVDVRNFRSMLLRLSGVERFANEKRIESDDGMTACEKCACEIAGLARRPGQRSLAPGMRQYGQFVLETARHESYHRYRIALVFPADGRMLDRALFV